ncbi:hypothetical protein [Dokdonella immobilis]|uniref:hypothetical protein n=1 Tax=Dokdonella immobilis TaxID=578942 RepID=UPI000B87FF80|nr:hypothetical protein [Dokdonella immobilis]
MDYFVGHPGQIFADRYLPWSCMFWIGCGILLLRKLDRAGPSTRIAAAIVSIVIPIALLPSHESWAGWGEAVFRNSQQAGAAALSDVYDARLFPDDESASTADVRRTLDLLKHRHLGMFSTAGAERLGARVDLGGPALDASIWMDSPELLAYAEGGRTAAHVHGT